MVKWIYINKSKENSKWFKIRQNGVKSCKNNTDFSKLKGSNSKFLAHITLWEIVYGSVVIYQETASWQDRRWRSELEWVWVPNMLCMYILVSSYQRNESTSFESLCCKRKSSTTDTMRFRIRWIAPSFLNMLPQTWLFLIYDMLSISRRQFFFDFKWCSR